MLSVNAATYSAEDKRNNQAGEQDDTKELETQPPTMDVDDETLQSGLKTLRA